MTELLPKIPALPGLGAMNSPGSGDECPRHVLDDFLEIISICIGGIDAAAET